MRVACGWLLHQHTKRMSSESNTGPPKCEPEELSTTQRFSLHCYTAAWMQTVCYSSGSCGRTSFCCVVTWRSSPPLNSLLPFSFIVSDVCCNKNIIFHQSFPDSPLANPHLLTENKTSLSFRMSPNSYHRKSQWGPGKCGMWRTLHFIRVWNVSDPGLGMRHRHTHTTHSEPNWTHLQFKYLLPCVGMAKRRSFPPLQYGAHTRTHTPMHVDTNDHTCTWDLKRLHNTAHF